MAKQQNKKGGKSADNIEPVIFTAQQRKDAKYFGFDEARPEFKPVRGRKKPETEAEKRALIRARNAWATRLIAAAAKGAEKRAKDNELSVAFKKAGTQKQVKKRDY